jgi:hypothetical protein
VKLALRPKALVKSNLLTTAKLVLFAFVLFSMPMLGSHVSAASSVSPLGEQRILLFRMMCSAASTTGLEPYPTGRHG